MLHLANSKTSIDGNFLSRELGVREQTARSMLTRIRLHLAALDHAPVVGNPGDTVLIRLERPRRIYMPGAKRRNDDFRRDQATAAVHEQGGDYPWPVLEVASPQVIDYVARRPQLPAAEPLSIDLFSRLQAILIE